MLTFIPSSSSRCRTSRGAFTLVEILVVVAIIALLISILIPALSKARVVARKAATVASLNALQTALSAYANDFAGAYPSSTTPAYSGLIPAGRGPAMLAEGLMGYLPGANDLAGPPTFASDPHYGFRMHSNGMGKIYGPYATDNSKSYRVNSDIAGNRDQSFIDPFGHDILYYRATGNSNPTALFAVNGVSAVFNSSDNVTPPPNATNQPATPDPSIPGKATPNFFQAIAPITTTNSLPVSGQGIITGSDSYLLISAGEDGIYYTDDDVILAKP